MPSRVTRARATASSTASSMPCADDASSSTVLRITAVLQPGPILPRGLYEVPRSSAGAGAAVPGNTGGTGLIMLPGLEDSAVRAGYVDAVVPPGLSPEDDIRARRRAGSFVDAVIRLAGGDETVLTPLAAEVRAAAVAVIALGLEPGV